MAISKFILLLVFINGAPILLSYGIKQRFNSPVDFGVRLADGEYLFGPTKTWRGIIAAILVGAVTAPVLGYDWFLGAYIAMLSMSGDLISSFSKRRMAMPSSSKALFLDQIPEVLLPALICMQALQLQLIDVIYAALLFIAIELLLSQILFRWGIRDQPY